MKTLYYKFLYRRLMMLAHRFDWHRMSRNEVIEPGVVHYWCHWCGLRSKVVKVVNGTIKSESLR